MNLVVVTGMSGAGRSAVANVLEDLGWYVVDNLPPMVLARWSSRSSRRGTRPGWRWCWTSGPAGSSSSSDRAARAARSRAPSGDPVPGGVRRRDRPPPGVRPPTAPAAGRRPAAGRHPARAGDAGHAARRRRPGDRHLDLNIHQLGAGRPRVRRRGQRPAAGHRGVVRLQERHPGRRRHGGRRALPAQPALGPRAAAPDRAEQAGRRVRAGQPAGRGVPAGLLPRCWTRCGPGTSNEGKRFATIAIGCTGGKHRSTAMAEEFGRRLRDKGCRPRSCTATWGANDRSQPSSRRAGRPTSGGPVRRRWSRSAAATGWPRRCPRCGGSPTG